MEDNNQEKHWCVYIHINKINGKVYIGQTCNVKNRWQNNGKRYELCTLFWKAIQKYGWNNFEHKILYQNLTLQEANELEVKTIQEYDSTNPQKGYNLMSGGENAIPNKAVREKLRKKQLGKHLSEETKEKIRQANLGKHLTEECKAKISANGNKGKHCPEEVKRKISKANKGKKRTQAMIFKMSKPVICLETNTIYYSIAEAERQTGINNAHITSCCKGQRHTAGGYHWKYYKKEN